MKDSIKSDRPIAYNIRNTNWKGSFFNSKNTYTLSITNKNICDNLQNLGCKKAKTFITVFPDIPENLYSHFIRGYFDGDGCIHISKNNRPEWSIIGTKDFISRIQTIINTTLLLKYNKLYIKDRLVYLKYGSKKDVKKLETWLYKDATIFMERKYNKFKILR